MIRQRNTAVLLTNVANTFQLKLLRSGDVSLKVALQAQCTSVSVGMSIIEARTFAWTACRYL